MSQEVAALQQLAFHGLYTDDNPILRPKGTASVCKDFRIMPGYWLRLRAGRKARNYTTAQVQQLFPFHTLASPGSGSQMGQFLYAGPSVQWRWFSLLTYTIDPVGSTETISLAYDSAFSQTNAAAITQISDRPVMYNGLGVRDGTNSRPPFSSYDGATLRYFGLDAYCIGGNPTVAFAAGAGNNTVLTKVTIWVGLWHSATDHYSNAVRAGSISTTGATGTITVSNLNRLTFASHNFIEASELNYVFYATIDGGQVPYLILNSSLNGPEAVLVGGSTTHSLSIAGSTTNGWNLDTTKEGPFDNFPPRPMRSIAFVNGRLYGTLLQGGSGSAVSQPGTDGISRNDFAYQPTTRDQAGVVWSRAQGDVTATDQLGDPLQSWPLANVAYTPNSESPLVVTRSLDDVRVLVITPSGTFLLEEVGDGVHEYKTVSLIHGITEPRTLAVTPYGILWMTQRNVLVRLAPGSMALDDLSDKYQSFFQGMTPTCADYLLDPVNDVDRYQVWMTDGVNGFSLCHDFKMNEAYTCTHPEVITAARTAVDQFGAQHHIIARNGVYTHEAQPDTGQTPSTDEFYNSPTTTVLQEINGEYDRNWDGFDDPDLRKGIWELLVIGDAGNSAQLAASPFTLEWYPDFAQLVSGNKITVLPTKAEQSGATDSLYRLKFATGYRRWYKFVFKLKGHHTDDASFTQLVNTANQGDLAKNFYASILAVMYRLRTEQNR